MKILRDLSAVVGVDQSKSKQSSPLSISGAGGCAVLGKVGLHQTQAVLLVAAVDDAQGGGGGHLGPVGGAAQPVQVVAEELVVGRPGVHQPVGNDGGRVAD